jgi:hypothetical protein
MTNFKGISKLKKEKESEMRLETDLVNQYKEAISGLFRTVSFEMDSQNNNNNNSFYYAYSISNFSKSLKDEFQPDKGLIPLEEIENFNRIMIDLLNDTVQFFIAVDNYDSIDNQVIDDIILYKTNIDDGFKNLGQFDLKNKSAFSTKDSSIAMKEYCFNVIKKAFYFLNNVLYIDLEKCPLKVNYVNLIYNLENSISRENIELGRMPISNSKSLKKASVFFDFIHNIEKDKKRAFAEELKITFNTESGIDFKIMIELLKDQNMFIIQKRKFKEFFRLIESYFQRDIGGYSGLNDRYKHTDSDKRAHKSCIKDLSEKLNPLIDKYKTKKVV